MILGYLHKNNDVKRHVNVDVFFSLMDFLTENAKNPRTIAAAPLARESYANKQKNEHAMLVPLLFTNKKVILSLVVFFD